MNIFELTLLLKGFPIGWAKKQLPKIEGKQIERRDAIVEWHRHNNQFYKELVGDKDIHCFEDLPIITKQNFHTSIEGILSDGYSKKDVFISSTSGSSGHPFFFAKDNPSHALTHAIVLDLYSKIGITPKDKQARFYGIPISGIGFYKEKLKDILSNRVRFPVFDLSDKQLGRYLDRFRHQKFGYVYGYTSSIVQFAKYCIRQQVVLSHICPSLKCCIVTSEVCTDGDRSIIEQGFGVRTHNEYGCSESGLIALEGRDGVWRMVEDENFFEVVDNDGNVLPYGKEGRILLTSLSNKAMPIIRYEIGDIGVIQQSENGLVLEKLSGRVNDFAKLPSGKISPGLTFYYISRSVLERNDYIREFIVRQTKLDTFVFDMVLDNDLSEDEKHFLQLKMDEYLEPGLKLIINRVERINRPKSGKIKHFYITY